MPERFAFRMKLKEGQAAEYERRHDEIFPQMAKALTDAGISDYSIWLDPQTNYLFAILTRTDDHTMDDLPDHQIVQRWWDHMADIMDVGAGNVPVQVTLKQVFHLK
ncbi:MAG: L-rhamnose mutarotase [Alphaproteobacteria bacterium]|nr:L-rhamnose mutarotase [Alphaproteobacteria bacterium]